MYPHSKRLLALLMVAIFITICVSNGGVLAAPPASATDVMRIEQDWMIELYSADPAACSPQIISGFPIPGSNRVLQFSWNHIDYPSFYPGGFQFQLWEDTTLLDGYNVTFAPWSGPEVTTWTTVYEVVQGVGSASDIHDVALLSLASTSWGTIFTPTTALWRQVDADVLNLNGYVPESSVNESAVIAGANHVKWFGILTTRYYNQSRQLLSEDATPRVIFQQ